MPTPCTPASFAAGRITGRLLAGRNLRTGSTHGWRVQREWQRAKPVAEARPRAMEAARELNHRVVHVEAARHEALDARPEAVFEMLLWAMRRP